MGFYNGTGSDNTEDCIMCPGDTTSFNETSEDGLDDRCELCKPGFFDNEEELFLNNSCTSCDAVGGARPKMVDMSLYNDPNGNYTFKFEERCECPTGQFVITDPNGCSQCPANSELQPNAPVKASIEERCICLQSYYFDTLTCMKCPDGSGIANNDVNGDMATRCAQCKLNFFGTGVDNCQQCPEGSSSAPNLGFGTGDQVTRCSVCAATHGKNGNDLCVPLSELEGASGSTGVAAAAIGIVVALILGFVIFIYVWVRVMGNELPGWFPARDWLMGCVPRSAKDDISLASIGDDPHPPLTMSFDVQDLPKKFVEFSSNSDLEFANQWDQLVPIGKDQPAVEYMKPENEGLNRYGNIYPYDRTRVRLTTGTNPYINANYLKGYSREKEYIATQGPLPKTQPDFWRMVWEQKSILIVMVTNEEEKRRIKCQRYWPQPGELKFGSFTVKMLGMDELPNYLVRKLSITDEVGEKRVITHLQYTGWPDHGVPSNSDAILRFCRHARSVVKTSTTPIIVHCSAGVGRSGTFITVDSMLQSIAANRKIDILNFVWSMRMSRIFMIQTEAQYIFAHKALVDSLSTSNIPRHSFNKRMKAAMKTGDIFDSQFEEVQVMSQMLPHSSSVGSMPAVQNKNRFANILPFDHNRVILGKNMGERGYINASIIPGYRNSDRPYIAAAAPVEESVNDFWKMVLENKTNTIVCLTKLVEKNRAKCVQYWPSKGKETYGNVTVKLVKEEKGDQLVIRTLEVAQEEESAYTNMSSLAGAATTVKLFHYAGFPEDDADDHSNQTSLLALIRSVNTWVISQVKNNGTKDEHIVVHCSSGAGRTGVYLAVAESIERVDNGDKEVDIKQVFIKLRTGRPSMIQTVAQYKFVHAALMRHLE